MFLNKDRLIRWEKKVITLINDNSREWKKLIMMMI